MDCVHNVIIQHEIFEVHERCDLLLLIDLIDYFLVLSQHIILNDLLPKQVDNFIIIDTVRRTLNGGILIETKTSLKGQLDSIEEYITGFIKHGFSFLNCNSNSIPFDCLFCHLLKGYLPFSILVPYYICSILIKNLIFFSIR